MEEIVIIPHHFMDIIKLYGAGIHEFAQDEAMGHDFYRIANEIIAQPEITFTLTTLGDDICKPCHPYQGSAHSYSGIHNEGCVQSSIG